MAAVLPALFSSDFPQAWKWFQEVETDAAGLTRIQVHLETVDAAKLGQTDLRLSDPEGKEVPYVAETPTPEPARYIKAKLISSNVDQNRTEAVVELVEETATEAAVLETPSREFLKPVQVEASVDGANWQTLARGVPVFRQANGVEQLEVRFEAGQWKRLRFTLSDEKSAPVPLTGVLLKSQASEPPTVSFMVPIQERIEKPKQTRLSLGLPAANLRLARIILGIRDPLFTRKAVVARRSVQENTLEDRILENAGGNLYRLNVSGERSERLFVPSETDFPTRECIVLIENLDSPPLQITEAAVEMRPVYLWFHAAAPGSYRLWLGNSKAEAPHYDLAALSATVRKNPHHSAQVGKLQPNPDYKPSEALAGLALVGALLEAKEWKHRKEIAISQPGAQRLELDPETLAQAEPDLRDLRVVREGKQIPYVLELPGATRSLKPEFKLQEKPKKERHSVWELKLPETRLPLTSLEASSDAPLFEREVVLLEWITSERGEKREHPLGRARWVNTPGKETNVFRLFLEDRPETDTLLLETFNGENLPIEFKAFTFFYSAPRIIFKASATNGHSLVFGNPKATAPSYDLRLVSGELLRADHAAATAGPLKSSAPRWSERWGAGGKGGIVFWSALGLAAIFLLIIITRLLPKESRNL